MAPLRVAAVRGGVVESWHTVHAVSVRGERVVDAAGDPELVTFWRSAAKPFQALPLARAVAALTSTELAIACASHDARPEQLAAVEALLARARLGEDALECGPESGRKLAHNCSGKHAGMLLLCRLLGWPTAGYRSAGHPLQNAVLAEVSLATGVPAARIPTAVDGCGVVTFALSLRAMAGAFSKLVARDLDGAEPVVAAVVGHPELVGGPSASDTQLMRSIPRSLAKRGAEGLLCAGLPDGTGVAIKVEDGSALAVIPAAGQYLGVEMLSATLLSNSRGEAVGELRAGGPDEIAFPG
jgi:L-asparaginase II